MRRPTRFAGLALGLAALPLTPVPSHGQSTEACVAAAGAANIPGVTNCFSLSVAIFAMNATIQDEWSTILDAPPDPAGAFTARSIQPTGSGHASASGSLAQSDAIPSVEPAGLASGSIAMVGSDAGNDAIAALGLNPLLLFLGNKASEALAKKSRLMDLSVFVPVTSAGGGTDETGDGTKDNLDYLGVRLRLNWLGLSSGQDLWAGATELLESALRRDGRNLQRIEQALARADDLDACVRALAQNQPAGQVSGACGGPLSFELDPSEAAALSSQLADIRRRVDSKYFGADIRVDVGDPTLGAVENASGTSIFAGVAFGKRFEMDAEGTSTLGLRGRIGAHHATLDMNDETSFGAEGGLGMELTRTVDRDVITASAGVEFRSSDADLGDGNPLTSDFVAVRVGLDLPIGGGNSISLSGGVPLSGAISSSLSVNFNWSLLLPDRLPMLQR